MVLYFLTSRSFTHNCQKDGAFVTMSNVGIPHSHYASAQPGTFLNKVEGKRPFVVPSFEAGRGAQEEPYSSKSSSGSPLEHAPDSKIHSLPTKGYVYFADEKEFCSATQNDGSRSLPQYSNRSTDITTERITNDTTVSSSARLPPPYTAK